MLRYFEPDLDLQISEFDVCAVFDGESDLLVPRAYVFESRPRFLRKMHLMKIYVLISSLLFVVCFLIGSLG